MSCGNEMRCLLAASAAMYDLYIISHYTILTGNLHVIILVNQVTPSLILWAGWLYIGLTPVIYLKLCSWSPAWSCLIVSNIDELYLNELNCWCSLHTDDTEFTFTSPLTASYSRIIYKQKLNENSIFCCNQSSKEWPCHRITKMINNLH